MPYTLALQSSFGPSNAGVATVGITILNADGTVSVARTTTGVVDLGGGAYGKAVTFADGFRGFAKWDTGTGSPLYATAPIEPVPTSVASAVWDKARNAHTTAGSFGEALQTATGTITTAAAGTVTLPAPYATGKPVGREIVIDGQARRLATHSGGGVYTLSANWDATPADGSEFWLGGVGASTPAETWAHTARSLTDKVGFALSATGLDAISVADFAGAANTIPKMIVRVFRRFFGKADKTANVIRTYADDGVTIRTTQSISVSGDDETQGAAS